jgi:hypothetical protein
VRPPALRDPLGKLLDPLRLSIKQARTDLRHCEGELDTGAKPLWVMAIEAPECLADHGMECLGERFLGRPCGEEVEREGVVLVPHDDVLFAREVPEEGPRRDRCRVGDLLDGRLRVSLFGEQAQRFRLDH